MINYLKSISRKAWWLIGWSTLYVAIALGYLIYEIHADKWPGPNSNFSTFLMLLQMPWIAICAAPLWPGSRLGAWVFDRPLNKPWFIIQELHTQQYVKVMADQPLFASNINVAQRWHNLEEAKACRDHLETRHSGPYDQYMISTVYRIKAKAK